MLYITKLRSLRSIPNQRRPTAEGATLYPSLAPLRGTGTATFSENAMARRTKQAMAGSDHSARLAALLDKLVAIDLDLKPIRRGSDEGPLIMAADAIAEACDILRSAIEDLRNIIHEVDGLTHLPGHASPRARRKSP